MDRGGDCIHLTPDGLIQVPYTPRKQFLDFHRRQTRFAVMVAHRRAGKTVACVNEIIGRAIYSKKKRPRYAYIGPLLKQAKKTAWEYLKEYTQGLTAKKPSESELSVRLSHNSAELGIYGADNPDSFRGQYFDGVILDEYGDMSPSLWGAVILPTLADRRGWAAFIGTFKGRHHFYRISRRAQGLDLQPGEDVEYIKKNWYYYLLSIDNSDILSDEEKRLQRSEMDDEEWEQEYRCNPNAVVKGTYYAKLISQLETKGQINSEKARWDPEFGVNVWSDLGVEDSTSLWFSQEHPDGYAFIDYHEAHSKGLDYYYEVLRSKPYAYIKINLPHDAKARTLQTNKSTIQLFIEEDKVRPFKRFDRSDDSHFIRLLPKLDFQDGINAARHVLPSCWFSPLTMDGVESLRAYRREWDEDTKSFSENPYHDWSSHGSDGFRYFATGRKNLPTPKEDEPQIVIPSPQIQLEVLFEHREKILNFNRRRV